MLTVHLHGTAGSRNDPSDLANGELASIGSWIDLFDPTEGEIADVEAATGIKLPDREQLSEVEASSRLRREGDRLYLALHVIFRDDAGVAHITPVGPYSLPTTSSRFGSIG